MSKGSVPAPVFYRLILFVAGDEPNSRLARSNLADLCREELNGECDTQIVDVLEDSSLAAEHNILVTPALVMIEPQPEVVVLGNLSDRSKLRAAFHRVFHYG